MNTRTINFGWNEIKETYQVECRSCDKKYKRTASRGFNDMATPEDRAKYRRELKAETEKLGQQKIICNACIKKGIKEPLPVEIVSAETIAEIAAIEQEMSKLDQRKKVIEALFRPHYRRLFTYKGVTYAQTGASFDIWGGNFAVDGYRISKTRPWETTDESVEALLAEITYLDDTLDARKAKAKGAT
jgi:hypothetical protein